MAHRNIDEEKDRFREQVWARMEAAAAGRTGGVRGKIPNFCGADRTADRLAADQRWRASQVVKANPDKAQAEVRHNALALGHLLYMAVPRIATATPFYELDPAVLTVAHDHVVTGRGAAAHAPRIGLEQMRPVEVVVCGSVAVNRDGARIGKGAGYSDLEVALLTEAGLISADTLIVTTVHPLQVLDDELPEASHDFRVDLIITPNETIECLGPGRVTGIVWQDLSLDQITEIPVLQHARDSAYRAPGG